MPDLKGPQLKGKIAVVAGATRGAGRGIARGLGEAGATVYCTGRSTSGNPSHYRRPETIEETAEMVTAAGGTGVPVRVDYTAEEEVIALYERIDREHGRVDVLVNSIAGEDPRMGGWTPIVKTDLGDGAEVLNGALLSHVISAKHAALLMIRNKRGLIVEVTEHDLLFSGGNALAQLVKFSLKGLAFMLAEELRKHRIAAVAVTPGFLRSESMLQHFGVTEESWREGGKKDIHFLQSESPLFLGRGIAALAADKKVLARTGDLTSSWELARAYGVNDADGSRPDWGSYFATIRSSIPGMEAGIVRHLAWLDRLAGRARGYLGAPLTVIR